MEYRIIIQENLDNGAIYVHTFPMEPCTLEEALRFRGLHFHSDCVFVIEYSLN